MSTNPERTIGTEWIAHAVARIRLIREYDLPGYQQWRVIMEVPDAASVVLYRGSEADARTWFNRISVDLDRPSTV